MNARDYLVSLAGQELQTLAAKRTNRVLRIAGEDVIVATAKSPEGKPVPIKSVQAALDMLERNGRVDIDVKTVGYRSAFIGAVLASLPGTTTTLAPPRVFRTKRSG